MAAVRNMRQRIVCVVLCMLVIGAETARVGEVIWAVNCGGEAHTDIHGVRYQRDTLATGTASDYGKKLTIQRTGPQDQTLYQTERYHTSTFGYDFPIKQDGEYALVLKFSEVWFTSPNMKVFDIMLNGEHIIVQGLDIYDQVGRGTAHDEIIPFTVKNGELKVGGDISSIEGGKVGVSFVKGELDNPKVNAIYVMKGTVDDVPKLPPLPGMPERTLPPKPDESQQVPPTREEDADDEDDLDDSDPKKAKKHRRPSGPKVQDPYASDDTGSMMLPVFVAIGAFIPLLFCLCKL